MSYCVRCGVRLDDSIKKCPLCNTPVICPYEQPVSAAAPYPSRRGQVEAVKKKDVAVLITIVLLTTAIVCGLLNFLVFPGSLWSLPIIGFCCVLWVFFTPLFIYTKLSPYFSILFNGMIIALYLFLLTFMTKSNIWFFELGLPVVILLTVLVELMFFLFRKFKVSILFGAFIFFSELAVLCVGIEFLIDRMIARYISLSWSAVVLTVCVIIDITLITLLSKKRLRNEVRRRLHF